MNKTINPTFQVVFGLLILSTALILIWDIIYNRFGEHEDGL